jgi:hypothetical protein
MERPISWRHFARKGQKGRRTTTSQGRYWQNELFSLGILELQRKKGKEVKETKVELEPSKHYQTDNV